MRSLPLFTAIFFTAALIILSVFFNSPVLAGCGITDDTDPCCCSGSFTACGGACGGNGERSGCTYTPCTTGGDNSCTVTYNLSPAQPENPNSNVTVTFPTLSSTNWSCVALFQDGVRQSCFLDSSAPNGLRCTTNSGSSGTHTLQLKYGQASLYPAGTNCGTAIDCNSTTYTTKAALPAAANPAAACNGTGTATTLSWNPVTGADRYLLRVDNTNSSYSSSWMDLDDFSATLKGSYACSGSSCSFTTGVGDDLPGRDVSFCATNPCSSFTNGPTNIVTGDPYNWSVQAIAPGESYPYAGAYAGGSFTCNSIRPTISSLQISNNSNVPAGFSSTLRTSGLSTTEGGKNWYNPMFVTLNAASNPGFISKYYVVFYNTALGKATSLSNALSKIDANAMNGFALYYNADGTHYVRNGGTWQNLTSPAFYTSDYPYLISSGGTILRIAPNGDRSWWVEMRQRFGTKNMYTAVSAENNYGLTVFEDDRTPI